MHDLTTDMLAVTQAQACMPVFFFEIDSPSGNLYCWSGIGTLTWNSQVWTGSGELLKLSEITENSGVQAAGVTLTLTGVPQALISYVLANLKRNYSVKLWIGAMDENFAIIADPYLFFNGFIDTSTITSNGETATINVTAESRLIDLQRPRVRRFTDLDQRFERPYDGGFKFVDFLQDAQIHFNTTAWL